MTRLQERTRQLKEATGGSVSCGWLMNEPAMLLYSLIKFYQPDFIIQFGHLWGFSALVCLEALTDNWMLDPVRQEAHRPFTEFVDAHHPKVQSKKFVSVDPCFEGVPNWQAGVDLLSTWYPQNFTFLKMRSADYFGQHFAIDDERIMTIVDGDHSEQGCHDDLEGSEKIGAEIIFLDDIDWLPHIGQVGRDFAGKYGYHYLPLHLYNGIAILTRKVERAL